MFAYLFTCQINTHGSFTVAHGCVQSGKNLSQQTCTFLIEADQGYALVFCFRSYIVNTCLSCDLLRGTCFAFLCFLLVISLKMAPKYTAEVSSGPEHKTVTCLMDEICAT